MRRIDAPKNRWDFGSMWPTVYGKHVRIVRESDYRLLLHVRKAGHRLAAIRPSQYGTKQHQAAVYFLQCALDALNKRSTKP